MAKSIILLILCSVVAMVFSHQVQTALRLLLDAHNSIVDGLASIFSSGKVGRMIQETIGLIIIPLFVGLLVAVSYWLVKRSGMPNISMYIWVVWTVLVVSMLSQPIIHSAGDASHRSRLLGSW